MARPGTKAQAGWAAWRTRQDQLAAMSDEPTPANRFHPVGIATAPVPAPAPQSPLRPLTRTEYEGVAALADGRARVVQGARAVNCFDDPRALSR